MKPIWKDVSSYSQSDKERVPKSFEIMAGGSRGIRIVVSRHIHYEPDQWLLQCHDLSIDNNLLQNKDLEKAQEEAIQKVRAYVKSLAAALDTLDVGNTKS